MLGEAQIVTCQCRRIQACLDSPVEAATGLLSGSQSRFRWLQGTESVNECEGWQFCVCCGTTVAHLDGNNATLLGFLNQPIDAMHQAVKAKDIGKVRELLARGLPADLEIGGGTPLMLAAERPQLEICRLLLAHGAMARLALPQRSSDLLRLLVQHGVSPQPLLRRVLLEGHVDSARVLLDSGVDLDGYDERGMTALHCAAHNSTAMVRLILAHTKNLEKLSRGGAHPLGFCALWGYAGRLKTLLKAGFPVDLLQNDPADSALFAACREGHLGCIRVLLEFEADPNLRCGDVTPLMVASHHGSLAVVRMLLEAGADPNSRDALGRTARNYAVAPSISGRHRCSTNSAGEPRVELSYGRGRWTCCHADIANLLPGEKPLGLTRVLQSGGHRLHSMEFSPFPDRTKEVNETDWRIIRRAARAGCAEAQCRVGTERSSLGWLRASAAQKLPEDALERLRASFGRRLDPYQHHRYVLRLAAELGSLEAMRDLAASSVHEEYDRTRQFADGYAKALPWYIRAARGGHRESQVAGGSMLIQGDGAPPDPVQGLRLLESAAAGDDVDNATAAAKQLARYYTGRYSVPADPLKAEYWQARAEVLQLEDDLRWEQHWGYLSRLRSP